MFIFITYTKETIPVATVQAPLCSCPACGTKKSMSMEFFNDRTVSPVFCYSTPAKPTALAHCGQCGGTFEQQGWNADLNGFYSSNSQNYRSKFRVWLGKFMIALFALVIFGGAASYIDTRYLRPDPTMTRREMIKNPQPGNVIVFQSGPSGSSSLETLWGKVEKVEGDQITVRLHKTRILGAKGADQSPDLAQDNFSDGTLVWQRSPEADLYFRGQFIKDSASAKPRWGLTTIARVLK